MIRIYIVHLSCLGGIVLMNVKVQSVLSTLVSTTFSMSLLLFLLERIQRSLEITLSYFINKENTPMRTRTK